MNRESTQWQFTLVSDLEAICSEISSHLSPFDDLKGIAEKAGISVSDCFVRLLYDTSLIASPPINLHTLLLDTAHTHEIPLIAPDSGEAYFTALSSEIQNTYLSLAQSDKAVYLKRLEKLCNKCKTLVQSLGDLEEHTGELKQNINEKIRKITPELINSIAEQRGLQTNTFDKSIPRLLEVARGSIWFFKPYRWYFMRAQGDLLLFAIRLIPNSEPKRRENQDARGKRERLVLEYDRCIRCGRTHTQAIDYLVNMFRTEYNPAKPNNRKKQIAKIIASRNNEEQ